MKSVSVIMSVYNEELDTIRRAIDSILQQTFKDFEIIIVIDNPNNVEAIKFISEISITNDNLSYIINPKNIGLPASLNKAIKLANGEYIARQDADDKSHVDRLEKQMTFIRENYEIGVLGTSLAYTEDKTNKVLFTRKYSPIVGSEIKKHNPLAHPTLVIRKEYFELYGYYDETNSRFAEDYDLWFRWYNQGVKFYNMNDVLYTYYQSGENKKNKNTKKQLKATIKVKLRYSTTFKFGLIDYVILLIEMMLLFLPNRLIVFLFYFIKGKQA